MSNLRNSASTARAKARDLTSSPSPTPQDLEASPAPEDPSNHTPGGGIPAQSLVDSGAGSSLGGAAVLEILKQIGPKTNSSPANYVRDSGGRSGALLIDKWKRYIQDRTNEGVDVSPVSVGTLAYDDYKETYPKEHSAFSDKPGIRSYFTNLVRNTKAAIARDREKVESGGRPTSNKSTSKRNKSAPTLTAEQQGIVQDVQVDLSRLLPKTKKRAVVDHDIFAKIYRPLLNEEKARRRVEIEAAGGTVQKGDSKFHHAALAHLWSNATAEQRAAVALAMQDKNEDDSQTVSDFASLRRIGPALAQNLHTRTGLGVVIFAGGRLEGTNQWISESWSDETYAIGDNLKVAKSFQRIVYDDVIVSAASWPLVQDTEASTNSVDLDADSAPPAAIGLDLQITPLRNTPSQSGHGSPGRHAEDEETTHQPGNEPRQAVQQSPVIQRVDQTDISSPSRRVILPAATCEADGEDTFMGESDKENQENAGEEQQLGDQDITMGKDNDEADANHGAGNDSSDAESISSEIPDDMEEDTSSTGSASGREGDAESSDEEAPPPSRSADIRKGSANSWEEKRASGEGDEYEVPVISTASAGRLSAINDLVRKHIQSRRPLAWFKPDVEWLAACSSDDRWIRLVHLLTRNFASLVHLDRGMVVVHSSLSKVQLPTAIHQWYTQNYTREPDRLERDNLINEFGVWYLGMQPAVRFTASNRSFKTMKAANTVPPLSYARFRSITQQGLGSLVHALAWMPDCDWPATGPMSDIGYWELVMEVSDVFKMLLHIKIPAADAAGVKTDSPSPPRVSAQKRKADPSNPLSPAKRVKMNTFKKLAQTNNRRQGPRKLFNKGKAKRD